MITTYNFQLNDKVIPINVCEIQSDYLLIHDNITVIALHKIDHKGSKVETKHTIFEATTEEECLAEIKRLNLEYTPEQDEIKTPTPVVTKPAVTPQVNSEPISLLDLLKAK